MAKPLPPHPSSAEPASAQDDVEEGEFSTADRRLEGLAMPERLIPGHESASEVSQSVPRGSELQRALAEAREPGFHFTAQEENTQVSAEVQRAVQAATRGLASMVGVASIQAGHDARGRPVVQVKAQKGFDAAAFAQLPEAFEGVRTLLALDYDLLPLKRKRG